MSNRKYRLDDRVENPRWREDDQPSHRTLQDLVDRGDAHIHIATLRGRIRPEYMLILETHYENDGRLIRRKFAPIRKHDYDKLKAAGIQEA